MLESVVRGAVKEVARLVSEAKHSLPLFLLGVFRVPRLGRCNNCFYQARAPVCHTASKPVATSMLIHIFVITYILLSFACSSSL